MAEGLEAKRAAFVAADAVCRHVLLLKFRNQGMAGRQLSATQAADLNKVEPLTLTRIHSAMSGLCMAATNVEIVNLYLAIVSPDPANAAHRKPVAIHLQFLAATRAELELPALDIPGERCFPLNVESNLIVAQLGNEKK